MGRKEIILLVLIIGITALALSSILIPNFAGRKGFKLGLDLKGGVHLVYKVDLKGVEDPDRKIEEIMRIIERRVNKYGVSEPIIQRQGKDRIIIQLPEVRDIEAAIELIGRTAQLDFRKVKLDERGNPVLENGKPVWVPAEARTKEGEIVHLTGRHLKRNTRPVLDPYTNEPEVYFELTDEGAFLFEQITRELLSRPVRTREMWERRLAIFLDNELISAPVVKSVISSHGVIEGVTLDEARRLSILLNEGALPTSLIGPIVREEVDPTLGADTVRKGLTAGVIGFLLVILFMTLYYKLSGVVASLALVLYVIYVLSVFKLLPVTLTLPGIAAFILSIGMAVDANVLIFERIKEEIRLGKSMRAAVDAGFSRAWPAIRDSNFSTFITCGILYWLGSKFGEMRVMGFALTLFIGVAISMLTALVITRSILLILRSTPLSRKLDLFIPGGIR